VTWCYCHW